MRPKTLAFALLVAMSACRTVGFDTRMASLGTRVSVDRVEDGSPIAVRDDHLVVMREGSLFSVRIGGDSLEPIDALELEPSGGYHTDEVELRLHRDSVIVIRERWVRGRKHVDIARVRLDADGEFSPIDIHTVEASRGLASISTPSVVVAGDRLYVYVSTFVERVIPELPRIERQRARATAKRAVRRLLDGAPLATGLDPDPSHVHAVVGCELAGASLECSTRAITGGARAEFHVAADAIYMWTSGAMSHGALVRFGLDGGPVSAVPVRGEPVEDAWTVRDGRVHALVRSFGVEPDLFDFGAISGPLAGPLAYVDVPDPKEEAGLHARLVGDTFVYGAGNGAGWVLRERALGPVELWTHTIDGQTRSLELPHTVELIDALGDDAIVAGTRGDALHLSTVGLDGTPSVRAGLAIPVQTSESMSTRGLFVGPEQDVVGIPIQVGNLRSGWLDRIEMTYFGVAGMQPRAFGSVSLKIVPRTDCRKRCGRGPSRPVFHQGRMFAMLRHELAEVAMRDGGLVELLRVDLHVLE